MDIKAKAYLANKAALILLVFLITAILTPSEYTCCRSLFPDENVDLSLRSFKNCQEKLPSITILTLTNSYPPPEGLLAFHCLSGSGFFGQPDDSTIALAIILRC